MTYLWTPGQRIQVTLDEWGAPLSFTWAGHGHTVGGVAKRWRVDEEWWQARIAIGLGVVSLLVLIAVGMRSFVR